MFGDDWKDISPAATKVTLDMRNACINVAGWDWHRLAQALDGFAAADRLIVEARLLKRLAFGNVSDGVADTIRQVMAGGD